MFEEYFNSIQASQVIQERVSSLRTLVGRVVDLSTMPHIFIGNTIDEEGNRTYRSLWIYGEHACSEATNFETEDRFDFVRMRPISRWEISLVAYDLGAEGTRESRFNLDWNMSSGVGGQMPATGANCAQLFHFYTTVVRPYSERAPLLEPEVVAPIFGI